MTNKVVKSFFLVLLGSSLFLACRKEVDNFSPTESQPITYVNTSMTTSQGAEGIMELAPQTENPYTIENMQAALIELQNHHSSECDPSIFNIRVTHKYIKFQPQDSIQYGTLIKDNSLVLFDYPMDRRIIKGGTYYRDPSNPEEQFSFQWTCVPLEKNLPSNVPYEVISELYLPEEDPDLVHYYDTEFDACITLLIDEALKLTGNYDTSNYYGGMTSGGDLRLPSKWTPKGQIKLTDNVLNNNTGLRGVKVRAHRWFETRESLTDANGNFNVLHQFRYPVDYSIKWERNDYNIRSGNHGQAYFNGPHQRGDWNLDIVSGLSWHYGQVHRGAFDYYYNNTTGLRTPPTNGFLGSRIAIGVYDDCDRADYRHWQRLWFGPEIRMYNRWSNCDARNSQQQYRTVIHELAHASHFNLSHWHFRNTDNMVQESWAVGVAWAFDRLRYSNPMHLQNLRLQNAPLIGGIRFDVVNWGERQYTPVVIDLIDNENQRITWGSGNTDFPVDSVSGYTIRTIEDALVQKRTMNTWRDQLKNNKPTGVTNARLDQLFLNYTPLQ